MEQYNKTHSVLIGYILWIFGFTGSERFYYGKPISGTIYFVRRQLELQSYGYRFLRINKFTLAPGKEGQTKIDVLNDLLVSAFGQ